jgi:hypothetical protein
MQRASNHEMFLPLHECAAYYTPPLVRTICLHHGQKGQFWHGNSIGGLNFANMSEPTNIPRRCLLSAYSQNQLGALDCSEQCTLNTVDMKQPYAQLIYRALLETPGHMMSVQEIYHWFRMNTDKAVRKGWQSSIRHNLSVNNVCNLFQCAYVSLTVIGVPESRPDCGSRSGLYVETCRRGHR